MIYNIHCTNEELEDILSGLESLITDRCSDKADREHIEDLIAKLQTQKAWQEHSAWEEEQKHKEQAAAFYADERNHLYVDSNGVGPIIELP